MERDEDLRSRLLALRQDHHRPRVHVGHYGPAGPDRFAHQSRVGVEPERLVGARVGQELDLVRRCEVAADPHVLPRHQLAGELLEPGEALLDAHVCRNCTGQSLHELELVGPDRGLDHPPDEPRGSYQCGGDERRGARPDVGRGDGDPPHRESRAGGVHHALPAQRELHVGARQHAGEPQLRVERGVGQDRRGKDRDGKGEKIVGRDGRGAQASAQRVVGEPDQPDRQHDVAQRHQALPDRSPPEQHVPTGNADRAHQDRERPSPEQEGDEGDAHDERGESLAGEGYAEPPAQCSGGRQYQQMEVERTGPELRVIHECEDGAGHESDARSGNDCPHPGRELSVLSYPHGSYRGCWVCAARMSYATRESASTCGVPGVVWCWIQRLVLRHGGAVKVSIEYCGV